MKLITAQGVEVAFTVDDFVVLIKFEKLNDYVICTGMCAGYYGA